MACEDIDPTHKGGRVPTIGVPHYIGVPHRVTYPYGRYIIDGAEEAALEQYYSPTSRKSK